MQTITVLGSTGSIGVSTLDVIARHPDRYQVFALTAHTSVEKLLRQCCDCRPRFAVMRDEQSAEQLRAGLQAKGLETEVLAGESGLEWVSAHDDVDSVMAAIVGAAGLAATLAAVNSGKKVLLANKESLVMAGGLFMKAVAESGAVLLPIDSEHNAIFQCMPANYQNLEQAGIRKILLTGSGGPFRQTPLLDLAQVTPDQACAHPNWSMGRKISVDSATMMNKGLEFIEACWMFGVRPDDIEVVVHPQSIIHSMVEYADGSVLAQMGNPDMRTPIAHAMAWPERIESGVASLNFTDLARLDFESPDYQRFPCLRLATEVAARGGTLAATLNAANEVAVDAFLGEQIGFTDIPKVIEQVLNGSDCHEPVNLDVVKVADAEAREMAYQWVARLQRTA
ncbi:MAG: 1-deoxy-D-xylulose-5-phosphate reductoisomerase [Candidatus Pelagadaptatus aseana]|uniref:1-deoxy-D-xylulose-5-phosphate reductoisomerase n=1 Tax=Candidatus Pelagadaptatus aseana TaxID=3120508 RepID=UPI0039B1411C